MKKKIFMGSLILFLIALNIISMSKNETNDPSLLTFMQNAKAWDDEDPDGKKAEKVYGHQDWSNLRNWLKSDRKQAELVLPCVYEKGEVWEGSFGVSSTTSTGQVGVTPSIKHTEGEHIVGEETICDGKGEGCNSLKCHAVPATSN